MHPPKGLSCPVCRKAMTVIVRKSPASGVFIRYRECSDPACGLRAKTREVLVGVTRKSAIKPTK